MKRKRTWIELKSGGIKRKKILFLECDKGMRNFGATCYFNAVFQILLNTRETFQWFVDENVLKSLIDPNSVVADSKTFNKSLFAELKNYFACMYKEDYSQITQERKDQLKKISLSLFKYVSNAIEGFSKNLFQFEQGDANLFFSNLFELFNKEHELCLKEAFQFSICSKIQCMECKKRIIKKEDFFRINIPVNRKDSIIRLGASINNYFQTEELKDYKCPGCGESNTQKSLSFATFPKVLMVSLLRYKHQSGKTEPRKIENEVEFDNELVINMKIKGKKYLVSKKYRLYGIICHKGNGRSGHFYSIISKLRVSGSGKMKRNTDFQKVDGMKKHVIQDMDKLDRKRPYIFFYELVDCID